MSFQKKFKIKYTVKYYTPKKSIEKKEARTLMVSPWYQHPPLIPHWFASSSWAQPPPPPPHPHPCLAVAAAYEASTRQSEQEVNTVKWE